MTLSHMFLLYPSFHHHPPRSRRVALAAPEVQHRELPPHPQVLELQDRQQRSPHTQQIFAKAQFGGVEPPKINPLFPSVSQPWHPWRHSLEQTGVRSGTTGRRSYRSSAVPQRRPMLACPCRPSRLVRDRSSAQQTS